LTTARKTSPKQRDGHILISSPLQDVARNALKASYR